MSDCEGVHQRPFGFWSSVVNLLQNMSVTRFQVPRCSEPCWKINYWESFCRSRWPPSASRGLVFMLRVWDENASWPGSLGADLCDLCVSRLVGGLDEHWLGQLLSCRHRHLLYLIQLLRKRRTDGEVESCVCVFFLMLLQDFWPFMNAY